VLAQALVASAQDRSLPEAQRVYAYMPYMHSESVLVHTQAVALLSPGPEANFITKSHTNPMSAVGVLTA